MIIALIALSSVFIIENILIIKYIRTKRKDNKITGQEMRKIYNPILREMKKLDKYINKMEY